MPVRTSASMAARNAASVLPEPVGAAISTSRPERIAGQARSCGSVGAVKVRRNQFATAGLKSSKTGMPEAYPKTAPLNAEDPEEKRETIIYRQGRQET